MIEGHYRSMDEKSTTTPPALPLVSIVMPTYNRAAGTLPSALESAFAQRYPNLEIVVCDNCSTDGTEELIRGYTDPRLRYIRHERNIGANENFNFCVETARGAYMLLLHDDDLIDPDFVDTCIAATDGGTRYGIIRTGLRIIDGNGALIQNLPNQATGSDLFDFVSAWFSAKTAPYCCNTLFNVQLLREVGGFRSRHNLFQDALAQVKVIGRGGIVNVPSIKASFRRHGSNFGTSQRIGDWCEDTLQLLDTLYELLPERREWLRTEGKRYLCMVNYGYVAAGPISPRWVLGYLRVARAFAFAASPVSFAYWYDLRPRLRTLKHRVLANRASAASA